MLLGGETTGVIDNIPAGESETISSGFVLGFGPCTITVIADEAKKTATGFLLGPIMFSPQPQPP